MTTTQTVPMSKKDHVKILRKDLAAALGDILTAESVLLDAQAAASGRIGTLIAKSGNPQHKFKLNPGTEDEQVILVTFRKVGEYMGSTDGTPVQPTSEGSYPAGTKAFPLYGMKQTDLDDED